MDFEVPINDSDIKYFLVYILMQFDFFQFVGRISAYDKVGDRVIILVFALVNL
jgi:hypothetical protein